MSNVMEYKGYLGKVEYSYEDKVLFGKIEGIFDLVTFDSENANDIFTAFKEAVDDYLFFCKECGKEPEKAYKGSFNIRISPELHKKIAQQAIKLNMTLNRYVEYALKESVISERDNINKTIDNLKETAKMIYKNINPSIEQLWHNNHKSDISERSFFTSKKGVFINLCKN